MKLQDHHIGFHIEGRGNAEVASDAVARICGLQCRCQVVRYVNDNPIYSLVVSGELPKARWREPLIVAKTAMLVHGWWCRSWDMSEGTNTKCWMDRRPEELSVHA